MANNATTGFGTVCLGRPIFYGWMYHPVVPNCATLSYIICAPCSSAKRCLLISYMAFALALPVPLAFLRSLASAQAPHVETHLRVPDDCVATDDFEL